MDNIGLLSSIFRKKWVIRIIIEIGKRKSLQYKEIEAIIGNPKSTTDTLSILNKYGILERKVKDDKYRTVEYKLSETGYTISQSIENIIKLL